MGVDQYSVKGPYNAMWDIVLICLVLFPDPRVASFGCQLLVRNHDNVKGRLEVL